MQITFEALNKLVKIIQDGKVFIKGRVLRITNCYGDTNIHNTGFIDLPIYVYYHIQQPDGSIVQYLKNNYSNSQIVLDVPAILKEAHENR